MFKGLQETIRNLNADLNNVSNCKKAKRLRRNLLLIGISLIIFALVGAVFCLIIFATEGFENLKNASKDINDFKIETILIPFIALIPIIIAGMIGVALTRLGFQIIITGYTSKLIDDAGLKGYHVGDAYVSEKHAGFIVNVCNATSEDVWNLINFIKNKIKIEKNIDLELEIVLL